MVKPSPVRRPSSSLRCRGRPPGSFNRAGTSGSSYELIQSKQSEPQRRQLIGGTPARHVGPDFLLLKTPKSAILTLGPSGIRGCRLIIGGMEIDDPESVPKSDYIQKSSSKSHVIRISEVVHIIPPEGFHKHSQFPTIYHFERSGRRKT